MVERIKYGSIMMYRWTCEKCGNEQFAGSTQCDDRKTQAGRYDRERVEVMTRRKMMSKEARMRLLAKQGNMCAWCGRQFGAMYYDGKRNKITRLRIHYDHILPYSYTANNDASNITASCHVCNLFKSSKVFQDFRDLSAYLDRKWRLKISKGEITFDVEYLNTFGVQDKPDGKK